jgi:hypothetical protein
MMQQQFFIRSRFKRLALVLVGFCQWQMLLAGNPVTERIASWDAPDNLFFRLQEINPAVVFYLPGDRYTEVSASFGQRKSGTLHYSFDGDDETAGQGKAMGFVKRSRSAARGEASYQKGIARNVRWSDVADARRVGPYILADTTGGDRHYEQYLLEGAIAWKTKKGYLGLNGSYRAEGSFRTRDPRASTNVSDLKLGGGGVFEWRHYLYGLAVSIGSYNQQVKVNMKTPDRKDYFYFLSGFGQYNALLSRTDSNYDDLDYSGFDSGISAFVVPADDHSGWIVAGQYNREKTDANYDEITPGIYRTSEINGYAGYKQVKEQDNHFFTFCLDHRAGKGTEQYYETIVVDEETGSTDKRFLSKSQKYADHEMIAAMNYLAVFNRSKHRISSEFSTGWQKQGSRYRSPEYKQLAEKWFVGGSGSFQRITDKSLAGIMLSSSYNHTFREKLDVPDNIITRQQVIPDFRYMAASLFQAGIQLQYAREVFPGKALSLSGNFFLIQSEGQREHRYRLTIAYHL